MKKLFIKFLYFFPVVLGISIINFSVDPARYFHNSSEKSMALALHFGKNVIPLSIFNDRLLQKSYIQKLEKINNILVLGSSRAMLIGSSLFINKSLFNSSVSGASVEDLIAIYSLYKAKGVLPEIIIIGVDPWLFNKNNELTSWLTLSTDYQLSFIKTDLNAFTRTNIVIKSVYQTLNRLFSPLYFRESIIYLINKTQPGKFEITTNRLSNLGKVIQTDGSIEYEPQIRLKSPKDVETDVENNINSGLIYSMNRYYNLDPYLIRNFEHFISELQKSNHQVIFFLAPYHPHIYSFMLKSPDHRIIEQVENYIINLTQKNDIPLIGSYNPAKFSLTEKDFYDSMHIRKESFSKFNLSAGL